MKQRGLVIVLLVGLLTGVVSPLFGAKRVAVMEFEIKGNVNIKDAGKIVAEWMSASLDKTGQYTLIERLLLKQVLEEQKLPLSGLVDEATAAKIGELYGAEAIVSGSVIEWQGIISVTARLVDVANGQVLSTASIKTRDSGNIPIQMDKLARVLAGLLPQEVLDRENLQVSGIKPGKDVVSVVKVIKKNGQLKGVIDRGEQHYIKKNQAFTIYMPKYGVSEITGQKTILGNEPIGSLRISYIERDMSMGPMKISPAFRDKTDLISDEGIALPFYGKMSMDLTTFGLGGGFGLTIEYPTWLMGYYFGYCAKISDSLPYGMFIDLSFGTYLLGNFATDFRTLIGLSIPVIVNFDFQNPNSVCDFAGGAVYLEFDIKNLFLRAEVGAGIDFIDLIDDRSSLVFYYNARLGYRFRM